MINLWVVRKSSSETQGRTEHSQSLLYLLYDKNPLNSKISNIILKQTTVEPL